MDALGDRLRALRLEAGWKQWELAQRIGWPSTYRSYLSAVENGRVTPEVETVQKILVALGRTWADLETVAPAPSPYKQAKGQATFDPAAEASALLLDFDQTARLLQRTPSQLKALMANGEIEHGYVGRDAVFPRSAVERFAESVVGRRVPTRRMTPGDRARLAEGVGAM